jgi:hypothetical protein
MDHDALAHAPEGVITLMTDYFEAMHTQDMEAFDRAFRPECVLYGVIDGELNVRPFDTYREAVVARQSPQDRGEVRDDRVLMFDQISDTAALVKPQLQMFGGVMQDYLSLSFVDGRWQIVAKLWERVGDAPA